MENTAKLFSNLDFECFTYPILDLTVNRFSVKMHLEYLIPDEEFESTEAALSALDGDVEGVLVDVDGVLMEVEGEHCDPVQGENVERYVKNKFDEVRVSHPVYLVTNRTRYETNLDVLREFFGEEVISMEGVTKPDSELFNEGLERLGVENPKKAVMIGDSPITDIYGANKVGMTTYQVPQDRSRYGFPENITKRLEDMAQVTSRYLISLGNL